MVLFIGLGGEVPLLMNGRNQKAIPRTTATGFGRLPTYWFKPALIAAANGLPWWLGAGRLRTAQPCVERPFT
jgi:hypothetical protein